MAAGSPVLVIACGALAREIVALKRLNGWEALTIECLPPELHNRPEKIPGAVHGFLETVRELHLVRLASALDDDLCRHVAPRDDDQ